MRLNIPLATDQKILGPLSYLWSNVVDVFRSLTLFIMIKGWQGPLIAYLWGDFGIEVFGVLISPIISYHLPPPPQRGKKRKRKQTCKGGKKFEVMNSFLMHQILVSYSIFCYSYSFINSISTSREYFLVQHVVLTWCLSLSWRFDAHRLWDRHIFIAHKFRQIDLIF